MTDNLAGFIRDRMDELGLSQADLVRLTGISTTAICHWVNSKSVPKTEARLLPLAVALQCRPKTLYNLWYAERPVRSRYEFSENDRTDLSPLARFICRRMYELNLDNNRVAVAVGVRTEVPIITWAQGHKLPRRSRIPALANVLQCDSDDLDSLWVASVPKFYRRRKLHFCDKHQIAHTSRKCGWICLECKNESTRNARHPVSTFVGVRKQSPQTWRAQVRRVHVGTFDSELEAARAHDREVIRLGLHLRRPGGRSGTPLPLNFPELARLAASAAARSSDPQGPGRLLSAGGSSAND